jgi:hypothetical protein
MDNLIVVMLNSGNSFDRMNERRGIDRVAFYQGFDVAEFSARYAHLSAEFARQETAMSLQPKNTFEIPEGK